MTESAVVSTPQRWDIFCTVVDNFGDIGVCWRLARQLVSEHGLSVRLWVDDLASFQRLCPMLRICAQQWLAGVEVRHWLPGPHDATGEVADVVIEAFACTIPAGYLAAMAERVKQGGRAPLWLNLEYLTAEPWAGEYHRLPSVEPRTGLRKYFFIPGFVPETGGLIREESLPGERDALQRNPAARADFLDSLGVRPASESLLMTLFAYETPALAGLLDALQTSPRLVHLLVPEGRITSLVQDWLGEALTSARLRSPALVRGFQLRAR
jgi:uncharacterized repeat protein (TIGR03837 family)